MKIGKVGLMTPGDMGQAVAMQIKARGFTVCTPKIFQGAAEIYRFVADTPLGKETPENRDKERSGKAVVQSLAQQRGAS